MAAMVVEAIEASLYLAISRYIYLYLPISPYISLYLPDLIEAIETAVAILALALTLSNPWSAWTKLK